MEGVGNLRIAVDSMGGDRAPSVVVDGALSALRETEEDLEVALVGREADVRAALGGSEPPSSRLMIVDAPEVVAMDEAPAATLRKKRQSSIAVGLRMQKEGTADGFISAGNTGAVAANAIFGLGRISGVSRPAIATFAPTRKGPCIILDVGANVENKPKHLLQFGVMGSCYAQVALRKDEPRVGLLNVGEERSKGGDLLTEAYDKLEAADLNFIGNVEGRDIFRGDVDVVVCDGFVGNVILKFTESVVDMFYAVMREELTKNFRAKIGAGLLKPAFRKLKATFDYAEYGGAPLLGVDGVCMICHGSSSAVAIKNAILATRRFIKYDVNSAILERLKQHE
jgi:glycerol-3-phosphate acyltransferase PlsX